MMHDIGLSNRSTIVPEMSMNIRNLEPPGNLLINVHYPIEFSPFIDIIPHLSVNLPDFVPYQPPSGEVFPLENFDENRGQLDFILSIVLPLREIFLLGIVIYLSFLLGFFLGDFSTVMVVYHFLLMEVGDIFVVIFSKSILFVQLNIIFRSLKNMLVVFHTV